MGPSLIFDKSTLESLSIDESVWLDTFYICNITPLFYVESLADLAKKPTVTRSATKMVSDIAAKTPVMGPVTNVAHPQLIFNDLLGNHIEMSGRPFIPNGKYKRSPDGKINVFHDNFPEMEAFSRWQAGNFEKVEHSFANGWRGLVNNLDFDATIGLIKNTVPTNRKLSNIADVKDFVDEFVKGDYKELYILALELLGIPNKDYKKILDRWIKEGKPSLESFAPYAAFCFKIEVFFYLCLHKSFISKERPSNKIDMTYLYYLPFCNVFLSSDNLHKRTAPLFMDQGQTFIWGPDFKEDMQKIDKHFDSLPDEIKREGVFKLAPHPPTSIDTTTLRLWDMYLGSWRKREKKTYKEKEGSPNEHKDLIEHLNKLEELSEDIEMTPETAPKEPDGIRLTRKVPLSRGKWRILPIGIENSKEK